jgi:type VI secretion system protein ImpE
MNAHDHYQAGRLSEAVAAGLDDVRTNPGDAGKRRFLCELLCFAGDVERADRHLDALGQLSASDPDDLVNINLFRQLVRAEQARQQFYSDGRLPEFLNNEVPPQLRGRLEAGVLLREGKEADAGAVLARAEEERPKVHGTCNGHPFDDQRDLDDLAAPFFEVLTSTGKYYWIPIDRVESVEFRAPVRPRDLLWRRAHMIVHAGPDGEVFLPTLYAGACADPDDRVRLGRTTEWRGAAPVRGAGQRMFLVGNDALSIMELQKLTFDPAAAGG